MVCVLPVLVGAGWSVASPPNDLSESLVVARNRAPAAAWYQS